MQLIVDTRERDPLIFKNIEGVSVIRQKLDVGDYGARHEDGSFDDSVVERKSVVDLYSSFTHNYENEKAKIFRAKEMGLRYVLAVEGSANDILRGTKHSQKSGIAQFRQLMTIMRKYGIELWLCPDREQMAFCIQEYFLAHERAKLK